MRPFGAAYQYSFSLTAHLQITGKEVYWGIKVSLHSPSAGGRAIRHYEKGGSEFTSEVIGIEAEYWDERAKEAYERADMVYKVKEILPEEYRYMRKDLIVFTYIHSNGSREQTDVCLEAGVTGIAYEDVIDRAGKFPLLRPMSAIADKGVVRALSEDAGLRRGLCFYQGQLTLEETGRKQNRPYISPEEALRHRVLPMQLPVRILQYDLSLSEVMTLESKQEDIHSALLFL